MKAKRLLQQRGGKLLKTAMEKAKLENRELTPGEWQALAKQNGGMPPGLPNPHPDTLAQRFTYESLEIDGDKAHLRYENGVSIKNALLVRIKGHWYVAGIF
jgi:hypothetical protein